MIGPGAALTITTWPREHVLAAVLTYRRERTEHDDEYRAWTTAVAAYCHASGDDPSDEAARQTVTQMIAAVTREHAEWFWRPARERLDRDCHQTPR